MRHLLRWVVPVLLLSPGLARAQAFEKAVVATLGAGVIVPAGSMSDAYNPGALGRAGLRIPISEGMSFGIESGLSAPGAKSGSLTLYQIPVHAMLYFPLAAEGSASPYLALGPGVTFNTVTDEGARNPDPFFGYVVKGGWAFRPEHMTTTLFELGVRYEQQFIGNQPDFHAVSLEACIGRVF